MPSSDNDRQEGNDDDLHEIHRWDEVPAFENEDDEDAFWSTHSLGDELLAQLKPVRDRAAQAGQSPEKRHR